MKCEDESSCKQAQDYIKFEYSGTYWDMFVTVYFLSLSTYWLYKFVLFFPSMLTAYRMRGFYRDRLHITSSELETMRWSEVVERLVCLQRSGTYKCSSVEFENITTNARTQVRKYKSQNLIWTHTILQVVFYVEITILWVCSIEMFSIFTFRVSCDVYCFHSFASRTRNRS